jgi:hypothetical protein
MTFDALITLLEREQFELGAADEPVQRAYRQGWNHCAQTLLGRLRAAAAQPTPPTPEDTP